MMHVDDEGWCNEPLENPEYLLEYWAYDVARRALQQERLHGKEPHPLLWESVELIPRWIEGKVSEKELAQAREIFEQKDWNHIHPEFKKIMKTIKSRFTFVVVKFAVEMPEDFPSRIGMIACYQAADLGQDKSWLRRTWLKTMAWLSPPYTEGFFQVAPGDEKAKRAGFEQLNWQSEQLKFRREQLRK